MKKLVKNGEIIDGTGASSYIGSVVIENDTIVSVGTAGKGPFDEVIDANGLCIAPGFIDTHSHSDVEVLTGSIILPKICQGITTEILGQDGVAMAPIPRQYAEDWRRNIGGLNGDAEGLKWDYPSIGSYLDAVEEHKPCANYACLAPHGNIRLAVMGFENRPATEAELAKMEEILNRQLTEGAIGLSTGLIYIPCVFADTNELIRLCRVVKRHEKVFVVHQRFQDEYILDSMEELETIVKESGVHLHISHIQVDGKDITELRFPLYERIERIKALGVTVTFDQYPYTVASTMMGAMMPAWAHEGGTGCLLKRLAEPVERAKIKDHLLHPERYKEENTIKTAGYEGIYVTDAKQLENAGYIGKNLAEISTMTGKHPIDAVMDLLLSEDNKVGMRVHYTTEECIKDHMLRGEMNLCTDGLLGGKPHPRVYGAFPRFLGKYMREEKLMPIEKAVRKMTGQAADAMGLKDRGTLAPGKKADLVLFNKKTIIDKGTFDEPRRYPEGIVRVMVNGITVVIDGNADETCAGGRVIRL